MVAILGSDWHRQLKRLVGAASERLVVAAPFVSSEGASLIDAALSPSLRSNGRVEVITDLSPSHVADGSLDPQAICDLCQLSQHSSMWHVPRFHAKVYIADGTSAIITSGNLTANAFYRNTECGILVHDSSVVQQLQQNFDDFRTSGTPMSLDDLLRYAKVAARVRATSKDRGRVVNKEIQAAFESAMQAAEEQLIRLRLSGGAMHTVFAKTLLYTLNKYGPMSTVQIHSIIHSMHPDLCDDSVDRVIDGKSYGKKWKHAVRTAQQQMKRTDEIELVDGVWRIKHSHSEKS